MTTKSADVITPVEATTESKADVNIGDRAMGASMIASGIGALTLGIMIILAEISPAIKSALTFNKAVGPLSGKTTVAVIAFFVSWLVLHFIFKGRSVALRTSFIVAVVLLVLGLLLTFPPVFMSFGG